MPFSEKLRYLKNKKKTMHSPGIMVGILKKRVLSFASQRDIKGGITLETTLLMTVYLSVVIPMICLLSIIKTQSGIQFGIENVARELAQKAYYGQGIMDTDIARDSVDKLTENLEEIKDIELSSTQKEAISDAAFATIAYGCFVNRIGIEEINESGIVGGIAGLDFSGSRYDGDNGVITVRVRYCTKIPFVSGILGLLVDERVAQASTWCGKDITSTEELVYITKNSKVYHLSTECTYLHREVKTIDFDRIGEIRNSSGKKYGKCQICKDIGNTVYYTEDGEKYHGSLSCSALNRNVLAVEKGQVMEMECCSKCAEEK